MLSALLDKWFKDTPGSDAFAERFMDAARRAGVTQPLRYDAELFRVEVGEGSYFNLYNAHHAYLSAPRGKQQQALDVFIRNLQPRQDGPQGWDEVRPLLRPVIRSISQLEYIRLHTIEKQGWEAANTLQYRRLTEECVEMLAIDHAEHMVTRQDGPAPEWNLTLDEALAEARRNLRDIDPVDFAPIGPGLFRAAWADCYDSSRALLPELVNRVPVAGRPVFLLATRDLMMVAGENDTAAQAMMFDIAAEEIKTGRVISWELLCHDEDGRIQAREPATEDLREKQAALRCTFRQDAYQEQKTLLDRIYQAHNEDGFAAKFMVLQRDGETFSTCSWAKDVLASIPRTDTLALLVAGDDEPRMILVPWDKAMAVAGHLLEADTRHLHPPRYITRGFPSAEQLAQMMPT